MVQIVLYVAGLLKGWRVAVRVRRQQGGGEVMFWAGILDDIIIFD